MLVITRKIGESFTFPALGIKIQINSISPGTAKVCIDAPREFRIVRSELPMRPTDFEIAPTIEQHLGRNGQRLHELSQVEPADSNPAAETDSIDFETVQRQLDAANLALHMAQNQVRSSENHAADENLSTALELLTQLELQLAGNPQWQESVPATVREPKTAYSTSSTPTSTWLVSDEPRLSSELSSPGVSQAVIDEVESEFGSVTPLTATELIKRLQFDDEIPSQLLVATPKSANYVQTPEPIKLPGISSLQFQGQHFVAGQPMEVWSR